ncbi:lactonase family protein [Candidatus Sumerlaeota bacterium]|nr:lactonase family protein [Candidatus Sumerlaeota bacterium]
MKKTVVAVFIFLLVPAAASLCADSIRVYYGTNGTAVYLSTLDLDTGALTAPSVAVSTSKPQFLAFSPSGQYLYAVRRDSPPNNMVRSFNVDPSTGLLTYMNEQSSGGEGPVFVKVDSTSQTLFVANYTSGVIASYPVQANGQISSAASTITHSGPLGPGQTGPHPHSIHSDPQNKWVYVPDLGMDRVMQYDYAPATSQMTALTSTTLPAGYGPRHMAFHPNGQWVYLACELANKVSLLYYDPGTGVLSVQAHYDAGTGTDTPSEVNVHPSGKFVYVGNRGGNTIGVFAVNQADGTLALVEREPCQGTTPRHFNVDPTGHWLIVANQGSGDVTEFSIDQTTGALTYTGTKHSLGSPMCVMFPPYEAPEPTPTPTETPTATPTQEIPQNTVSSWSLY